MITPEQEQRRQQLLNSPLKTASIENHALNRLAMDWIIQGGLSWAEFLERAIVEMSKRMTAGEERMVELLKAQPPAPILVSAKLIEQLPDVAKIKEARALLEWWLDPKNQRWTDLRLKSKNAANYRLGLQIMHDALTWALQMPVWDEASGKNIHELFQENLDGLRKVKQDIERWMHTKPELN